jgi:hypothetical protein
VKEAVANVSNAKQRHTLTRITSDIVGGATLILLKT